MAKNKGLRGGGLPGRGFGTPGGGGMGNLLSQMQKMQQEMEKTTAALALEEFSGSAGGGMVNVVVNGAQEVKSITIKPEAVNAEDVELLQDMVLAAINDALNKARDAEKNRLGALTGGLGIPGL
jgi:hypothetical protein